MGVVEVVSTGVVKAEDDTAVVTPAVGVVVPNAARIEAGTLTESMDILGLLVAFIASVAENIVDVDIELYIPLPVVRP